MIDNVSLSIAQVDGAWRVMCAGAPRFLAADGNGVRAYFQPPPHQLLQYRPADRFGTLCRSAERPRTRGVRMGRR